MDGIRRELDDGTRALRAGDFERVSVLAIAAHVFNVFAMVVPGGVAQDGCFRFTFPSIALANSPALDIPFIEADNRGEVSCVAAGLLGCQPGIGCNEVIHLLATDQPGSPPHPRQSGGLPEL